MNRFCAQAAIGHPLTVYGEGGQKRGFLDIRDMVRCIEIACLNPAKCGECRVFNQFTEQFSVLELARMAQAAARELGIVAGIEHLPGPRAEKEQHYYNARHSKLLDLGLRPHHLSGALIDSSMKIAIKYRDWIDTSLFLPRIEWQSARNERRPAEREELRAAGALPV